MANDWDDMAAVWDTMPPVRDYANRAFADLTGHIDLTGLRILDFGCGTGLLTEHMATKAAHITAVDLSGPMIDVLAAKAMPNVTARQGDVMSDDIRDVSPTSFDLITAASVCAFVPDYPATLGRLPRLLSPGGWFIQWDWEDTGDGNGLSASQMTEALDQSGLINIAVGPAFTMEMVDTSLTVLSGRAQAPT